MQAIKQKSRKEYFREYYLKNREKKQKNMRIYRLENADKIKAHCEKPEIKARKAAYMRKYRQKKLHEKLLKEENKRNAANYIREKRASLKNPDINKENAKKKILEIAEEIIKTFS